MLFPVTIYNANGKVKEDISKESLYRRNWKIFQSIQKNYTGAGRQTISKEIKKNLNPQYPEGPMNRCNYSRLSIVSGQVKSGPIGRVRIKPFNKKLRLAQALGFIFLTVVAVKMFYQHCCGDIAHSPQ